MPVFALMMERCPDASRDSLATNVRRPAPMQQGIVAIRGLARLALELVIGDRGLGA